ncbi:MAG: EAL domain-containing protein [Halomonas sp.]|nr:EAL domain-containing protein [Halomonas sp.]MCC5882584.1 EAL domain-containing protein [Halomonas sp.]
MTQGNHGADSLLLASQPIFDRANEIYGVELFYRNEAGLGALDVGESLATSEVVYHLSTAITRRANITKVPAFINVSTNLLLSPHFLPVSPSQVIIELVERIVPSETLIHAVQRLHDQGYRFALDDFAFSQQWDGLLSLASYIKVDISTLSPVTVEAYKKRLSHLDVKWVAERVETRAEHERYLEMGFDLFQGYFYAQPKPVYGKKIPASTLQATVLLQALCRPEPELGEIVALIQSDPELALKLTRVANNAFHRQQAPISSLYDVVTRLGFRQLTSWVAMLGLLGEAQSEHAELALTRAKACELLAKEHELNAQDAYFIGLLSTVDLLLGVTGEEFLKGIELDASTSDAILHRAGAYGHILHRVEGTERQFAMHDITLYEDNSSLLGLYHQANHHAQELLASLAPA